MKQKSNFPGNSETPERQESSNNESPIGPVVMIGIFIVFVIVMGLMVHNVTLENEYNARHTYVECVKTGGYVCSQVYFGGCARYEPETKCQRYRKSGSPTFNEWKSARDR